MSRRNPKPRSDAKLKTLPEDVQADLYSRMKTAKKGENTSYDTLRKWLLAEWDIDVKSDSTFTEFWDWYPLTQAVKDAASTTEALIAGFQQNPNLKLDAAQSAAIGQAVFEMQAVKAKDADTFIALQRLALERRSAEARGKIETEKLKQGDRRIILLEKKAAAYDEAKGIFENKELTPDQREQMMKEKFGL